MKTASIEREQLLILEELLSRVCDITGASPSVVFSKTRLAYVVEVRNKFCYVAVQTTDLSLATIGSFVGRDHTTVLHAQKYCRNRMSEDEDFKSSLLTLLERIKGEEDKINVSVLRDKIRYYRELISECESKILILDKTIES